MKTQVPASTSENTQPPIDPHRTDGRFGWNNDEMCVVVSGVGAEKHYQVHCRKRQLTAQDNHLHAVACFGTFYTLIAAMEDGEERVFGDEIGSWMMPGDE